MDDRLQADDGLGPPERLWRSRLRWRMRGAWMWPTYVAATIAGALLLHYLPFSGDGLDPVPAFLAAGFANLFVVAVLAPIAGYWVRRRRADLPKVVATDYAGTGLLLATVAALVAGGLAHRPVIVDQDRNFRAQSAAARDYIVRQAPAEYHGNVTQADTLKLESDLYRTCVPGNDPKRDLCLFINTDQAPPGVKRDVNREPNASFAGRHDAFEAR